MKTIVVTFFDGAAQVARATGRFEEIPGEGSVVWEGDLERHLTPQLTGMTSFKTMSAETFAVGLVQTAERVGLTARVEESGTWRIFAE